MSRDCGSLKNYSQELPRLNRKQLENCSIEKCQPYQPKPVAIETFNPNITRPQIVTVLLGSSVLDWLGWLSFQELNRKKTISLKIITNFQRFISCLSWVNHETTTMKILHEGNDSQNVTDLPFYQSAVVLAYICSPFKRCDQALPSELLTASRLLWRFP